VDRYEGGSEYDATMWPDVTSDFFDKLKDYPIAKLALERNGTRRILAMEFLSDANPLVGEKEISAVEFSHWSDEEIEDFYYLRIMGSLSKPAIEFYEVVKGVGSGNRFLDPKTGWHDAKWVEDGVFLGRPLLLRTFKPYNPEPYEEVIGNLISVSFQPRELRKHG
jgi:hypothetical protein